MFCHLFCRTARGLSSSANDTAPLAQLRDQLFDTHGAPPAGVAQTMAAEIRRIKTIDAFPPFLKEMGSQDRNMPGKYEFTIFLRNRVRKSVEVGYSNIPISQTEALALRRLKEPDVEAGDGMTVVGEREQVERALERGSFFPNQTGRTNGGERDGRRRRR